MEYVHIYNHIFMRSFIGDWIHHTKPVCKKLIIRGVDCTNSTELVRRENKLEKT
jgi:hypothetical protein